MPCGLRRDTLHGDELHRNMDGLMKRLLGIFIVLVVLTGAKLSAPPAPVHAQILQAILSAKAAPSHHFTVGQTWTCANTGDSTGNLYCTATSGFTAGDAVIVPAPYNVTTGVSPSGSFALFPDIAQEPNFGGWPPVVITGVSGGSTSFTFSGSPRVYYGSYSTSAYEVSGVNSSTPVATPLTGWAHSYSSPTSSNAVTVSGAAFEICAVFANGGPISAAGSGYYILGGTSIMECSTGIVSSGTYTPTVTLSGSSWSYGSVAFILN